MALAMACAPPAYDSWLRWLFISCFFGVLIFSDWRLGLSAGQGRRLVFLAAALALGAARALVPHLQIDEGFNVFAVGAHFEIFERDLPPTVYRDFQASFLKAYPEEKWCSAKEGAFCWRGGHVPSATFAFAPESVWTAAAPRSRLASGIDFTDLPSLRGAFANELGYKSETLNWYNAITDVRRESMPFFVSYRFDPRMAGGTLCWQGSLFWLGPGQTAARKEAHPTFACENLEALRLTETVYGLSVPTLEPLSVRLTPEFGWRAANWLRLSLEALSLAFLAAAALRPRWRRLRECGLLAALSAIGLAAVGYLNKFGEVIIFSGGDDGLAHYGFGRAAFQHFVEGSYLEGLRAAESTFYFMPGLRYFRVVEMLFFGPTNFGYLMVVLAFPTLMLAFARGLGVSTFGAWLAALIFAAGLSPGFVGFEAVIGYAETLGYFLCYLGLLFTFQAAAADGESDQPWLAFLGAITWALAMAVRPNLAVGGGFACAALLVWLVRRRRLKATAAAAIGFSFSGACLLHNFYFGHRLLPFVIIDPQNLGNPPMNFVWALIEALSLNLHGPGLTAVRHQLGAWSHPYGLFSIVIAAVGALAWRRRAFIRDDVRLQVLLCAVIGLQGTLLVFRPFGRYGHAAWTLTVFLGLRLAETRWGSPMTWRRASRR